MIDHCKSFIQRHSVFIVWQYVSWILILCLLEPSASLGYYAFRSAVKSCILADIFILILAFIQKFIFFFVWYNDFKLGMQIGMLVQIVDKASVTAAVFCAHISYLKSVRTQWWVNIMLARSDIMLHNSGVLLTFGQNGWVNGININSGLHPTNRHIVSITCGTGECSCFAYFQHMFGRSSHL